jgi:hypothetical protein
MKKNLLNFSLAIFMPFLIGGSLHGQCTAITPTVSNSSINCGGTSTLTATGAVGYQWWDQSSGGTLLGSNATYTTPALTTNTSYYVNGTDNSPQTLMGLPAHSTPFSGNVRGYYFTAPVDFTITGLKIPVEVSGLQNICVIRLTAIPPLYSTVTNSFTTLFLTQNDPTAGIISVNIPVTAGDIIGILGQAGNINSYSASATSFPTTIGGQPVNLARMGMQYPLATNVPHDIWTEPSGSISRVEMYYTTSCASSRVQVDVTVAPIPVAATAVNPSICSGSSTTLNATGATTYTWEPGSLTGTSVSVSPTSTTTYTVTGNDPGGCSNTNTVTVTVNPAPTVVANGGPTSVCSGSPVTLTGSGAASYTWDNGITDGVAFNPTATTTYMVTGTDVNGCQGMDMITVNVDPLPTVTASSTASSVCPGDPVILTGGGSAVLFIWDNSVTDGVAFNPTTTTTYQVDGADANGCSSSATITVTVNPLPTVTANSSSASVCMGGSVTLTGGGATSYTWDNSVTDGVSFVPASTITYMVTGTDGNTGCVNTATTTVTVNALPIVDLGPDVTQCEGPVTLDAGNAGSTYVWSNSNSTQTISVSSSGTYSVVVTDPNGCTGSDGATVTINALPTVTATASGNTVCFDDANVTLTGTPAAGTWSGTGVTGSSFDPSTAGNGSHVCTYTFTDANGCTNTATTSIQVNACTGVVETTLLDNITVFPNPASGTFTLSVNALVGNLLIELVDMEGRVVYTATENNVQYGFAKQISTGNFANGVYMLRLTSSNEQQIEKITIQN